VIEKPFDGGLEFALVVLFAFHLTLDDALPRWAAASMQFKFAALFLGEGHYVQRSCEPRKQAEHMAAPTNAANVKNALANSEPSTHGTEREYCRSAQGVRKQSYIDPSRSLAGGHRAASLLLQLPRSHPLHERSFLPLTRWPFGSDHLKGAAQPTLGRGHRV
jgi:hypothetical protein